MIKTLISFILPLFHASLVEGPIELLMPSETKNIVLTEDQQTMIATFNSEQLLKVFRNNKQGFELFQTIPNLTNVFNVAVSEKTIATTISNKVKIF